MVKVKVVSRVRLYSPWNSGWQEEAKTGYVHTFKGKWHVSYSIFTSIGRTEEKIAHIY